MIYLNMLTLPTPEIFKYADLAYPGDRDNRSTLNTKTGYDDDE